jgi:Tol biopolymer transport system component
MTAFEGRAMKRIVIALGLALTAAVLGIACGGDGGPVPLGPSGTVGPDSGIAFISKEPGSPSLELYLVDADTGAVQQLTDTEDFEWWPEWSPDRQRLAFITWPASEAGQEGSPTPTSPTTPTPTAAQITQRHLVVANADGSDQRPIGDSIPLQTYSGGFSWSPDSSQIVHMAVVDPTERPLRARLRLCNVADGSEVPLAEERLGFLPAWSPDGTKIVFGAFVGELDEEGKGESELFLMDSDGSNLRQITDHPGTDVDATWSPDGTRIVWWGENSPSDPSQTPTPVLFMMDVASGQITTLGEGSYPVWSPDGEHIMFVLEETPPPGVVQAVPDVNIYTFNVDTGERTQLSQDASPDLWPTWSPDGQRIAFVSQRDNLAGDIYVMNADGSDVRRLTDNTVGEMMLSWAPR